MSRGVPSRLATLALCAFLFSSFLCIFLFPSAFYGQLHLFSPVSPASRLFLVCVKHPPLAGGFFSPQLALPICVCFSNFKKLSPFSPDPTHPPSNGTLSCVPLREVFVGVEALFFTVLNEHQPSRSFLGLPSRCPVTTPLPHNSPSCPIAPSWVSVPNVHAPPSSGFLFRRRHLMTRTAVLHFRFNN